MLAPFLLMALARQSPCKVNLLLNVLGGRADGFHELETVLQPLAVCDELDFRRGGKGIQLTCSEPALATDPTNLVHRAATAFLRAAKIVEGVRIHRVGVSRRRIGIEDRDHLAAHNQRHGRHHRRRTAKLVQQRPII